MGVIRFPCVVGPPDRDTEKSGICVVPQFVAEELLKAEGFTDVQYVQVDPALGLTKFVAMDHADLASSFAGSVIVGIDAQEPVLLLAGMHVGCYELSS